MKPLDRVVVYDFDKIHLSVQFISRLRVFFRDVKHIQTSCDFSGALALQDVQEADALITRVFDNYSFLERSAPNLRYIGSCHTDLSHFPLSALRARGTVVTNVPKYAGASVAELTVGMLLSISRRIADASASVREGRWLVQDFIGEELGGKTVGLIGYGDIGSRVGAVCQALGMHVRAFRRSSCAGAPTKERGITELIQSSNVIVVACPLTDATRGLISKPELDVIQDGSIVLVPARTEIFDESCLLNACKENRFSIWLDELQDSRLRAEMIGLPNVHLTPDYGWLTRASLRRQENSALQNLEAWISSAVAAGL